MSAQAMLCGGWNLNPIILEEGKLPQNLATGFPQAFEGFTGNYKPLVYCGTQIVNGTNHMIICEATLTTNPPTKHISKVILHETIPAEGQVLGTFSILLIDNIV